MIFLMLITLPYNKKSVITMNTYSIPGIYNKNVMSYKVSYIDSECH